MQMKDIRDLGCVSQATVWCKRQRRGYQRCPIQFAYDPGSNKMAARHEKSTNANPKHTEFFFLGLTC